MNILEFIEMRMAEGYTEEQAEIAADVEFNLPEYDDGFDDGGDWE